MDEKKGEDNNGKKKIGENDDEEIVDDKDWE